MFFDNYSMKVILLAIIALLNLASYFLYYADKKKAINRQPRISEKTLLLASVFFGGLGALVGMKQFRHKTKRLKFKVLVPIAGLLTLGAIYFVFNMT